jgi:2'-5' RNA ligase
LNQMRMFIAVELPARALEAAAEVSCAWRDRLSSIAPAARLTWVPVERIHLTLRFLGNVTVSAATAVVSALDGLETAAFELSLGEPGVFPARGAPRVLWLGLGRGGVECTALEREVSQRLAGSGFPPAASSFSPHVTLARVRDPRGLSAPTLTKGVEPVRPGGGRIDAITLFESRLSSAGPTYTPFGRMSLRPA